MRVVCRHGHFAFYPRKASDVAEFALKYSLNLVREEDYFTFSSLADAPTYSLPGSPYLGIPARATFEGNPWDVMRKNDFVFDYTLDTLVPKLAVVSLLDIHALGLYMISDAALIQPGSRDLSGDQVLSYSGEIYLDKNQMRISEFAYE